MRVLVIVCATCGLLGFSMGAAAQLAPAPTATADAASCLDLF